MMVSLSDSSGYSLLSGRAGKGRGVVHADAMVLSVLACLFSLSKERIMITYLLCVLVSQMCLFPVFSVVEWQCMWVFGFSVGRCTMD